MSNWSVEFWRKDGESPAHKWFSEQPSKVQAKFAHVFDLLEDKGILVGMPHVRPLGNKLFEIRVEQNTNTYRIIHFAYTGNRFILLHGFQKKTNKTPETELDLAKKRMQEFLSSETMPSTPKLESKSKRKKKRKK